MVQGSKRRQKPPSTSNPHLRSQRGKSAARDGAATVSAPLRSCSLSSTAFTLRHSTAEKALTAMESRAPFMRRLFRIERHSLGPRIFVFGIRAHDWHLGLLILLGLGVGALLGHVNDTLPTALAAAAGAWLIVKDWRDVTPRRRDTTAWRIGLHRRPHALRELRRADPLPLLVAVAAAAIAIVDLLSALTPNVRWRGHLLLKIEAVPGLRGFHALPRPVPRVLPIRAYAPS